MTSPIRSLLADRTLVALTAIAVVVGSAAVAAPLAVAPRGAGQSLFQAALASVAPPPRETVRLVWDGADVDADGKADFANPTGQETREHDVYGDGEYGASRDGGVRRHEGVDFKADAGQDVVAPISGYITKIGYAYAGHHDLKFVEITNPALHYEARVFYVDPRVEVGDTVAVGHRIGTAHSLQRKYPGGMTDHVHLEVMDGAGVRFAATKVITETEVASGD